MRIHPIIANTLAALLFASAGHAQTLAPAAPAESRLHAGISLLGAAPRGDFGQQIERAFGVGMHAQYRLDSAGHIAIRVDGSWLNHGMDFQDVALVSPLGGTHMVELTTTNNLVFLGVGPELSIAVGNVRPYAGASAGVAYFVTDASGGHRGSRTNVATRVQHEDVVFAYGGQVGLRVPMPTGARNTSLDVGVRYQQSDRAEFVRKGGLSVNDAGRISLSPVQASADVLVFHVGVLIPLSSSRRGT